MATTTRGYPIYTGGMVPAGPAQMQQLAESIDADVTAVVAARVAVTGALNGRLNVLENDPAQNLPTLGGWSTVTDYEPGRVQIRGKFVEHRPTLLARSATLAVAPGVPVTFAQLPVGYRPAQIVTAAGTIGVAGVLGAAVIQVWPDGAVRFISLVANGTMASGGGWGNHLMTAYFRYPAAV